MLRHNKIENKKQANKNERGGFKFGMLPNALAHFSKHVFGFLQTAHVLQIAVIHPEPFCITGKSRRHQNDKFL